MEIIEQIAQTTRMAVAEPTYKQMLTDSGMEAPLDSNPETFRQSLAADVALWAPGGQIARAEARLAGCSL
jgi:hypothetical protein